jgi:hypothetical protein
MLASVHHLRPQAKKRGTDMKHFYASIQGWSSFLPWYKEAVAQAPGHRESVFVEIGTWKGRSAAYMGVEIINSMKPISFFTCDTFQGSDEPKHQMDPAIRFGMLEQMARQNLKPLTEKNIVTIAATDSVSFSSAFKDGEVDFVFVDGDHTYEGCTADLQAWWPKLRDGGTMAGDDFTWRGVKSAVTDFFYNYHGLHTAFGAKGDKCWRIHKDQPRAA